MSQDKEKKVGDIKKTDGEDNNINDLYIMQAEFFRELGQFDESIKILNKITNDNERKDKLLKACQEKNSNLIKFEREKINSVD